MKKLLIIFFMVVPLFAQSEHKVGWIDGSIHTFRLKETPDFDGWSIGHAFGGYVVSQTLKLSGVKPETRLWIVFGSALFWEIYKDGFGNKFLDGITREHDPKGADLIGDVFFTLLGSILEILLNNALGFR